ncbi:hypothetical protein B0F90DRAFT_191947 [Multifurca ochricompacta]|uniref:Uncharacterized protein n=1 Tax=Multifurca ochricompacta TaxID=376703 RepID=A0AAD4LYP6_9AGAM|nr:hypothetical protein B0F90DRAFT_191947 [Multifurca ochricompacta]
MSTYLLRLDCLPPAPMLEDQPDQKADEASATKLHFPLRFPYRPSSRSVRFNISPVVNEVYVQPLLRPFAGAWYSSTHPVVYCPTPPLYSPEAPEIPPNLCWNWRRCRPSICQIRSGSSTWTRRPEISCQTVDHPPTPIPTTNILTLPAQLYHPKHSTPLQFLISFSAQFFSTPLLL